MSSKLKGLLLVLTIILMGMKTRVQCDRGFNQPGFHMYDDTLEDMPPHRMVPPSGSSRCHHLKFLDNKSFRIDGDEDYDVNC